MGPPPRAHPGSYWKAALKTEEESVCSPGRWLWASLKIHLQARQQFSKWPTAQAHLRINTDFCFFWLMHHFQ